MSYEVSEYMEHRNLGLGASLPERKKVTKALATHSASG
jgi:hypothetical protein